MEQQFAIFLSSMGAYEYTVFVIFRFNGIKTTLVNHFNPSLVIAEMYKLYITPDKPEDIVLNKKIKKYITIF